MTAASARMLTLRAHIAFAAWLLLGGSLVLVAVLLSASVAAGSEHTPPATLFAVPALLWFATWLGLTFGTVWWYRRGIGAAAAAADLATRERASRLMQVRAEFVGRNLAGVHLAGLPATAVGRWLDSWRPLALHLLSVLLLILTAAGTQ